MDGKTGANTWVCVCINSVELPRYLGKAQGGESFLDEGICLCDAANNGGAALPAQRILQHASQLAVPVRDMRTNGGAGKRGKDLAKAG